MKDTRVSLFYWPRRQQWQPMDTCVYI